MGSTSSRRDQKKYLKEYERIERIEGRREVQNNPNGNYKHRNYSGKENDVKPETPGLNIDFKKSTGDVFDRIGKKAVIDD